MLYDPKWDADTKADPFSLASLIAWLEKQPPGKTYCYTSNGKCMIARYLINLGHKDVHVGGSGKWRSDRGRDSWEIAAKIAIGSWPDVEQWTFGAALERARKVAAQTSA